MNAIKMNTGSSQCQMVREHQARIQEIRIQAMKQQQVQDVVQGKDLIEDVFPNIMDIMVKGMFWTLMIVGTPWLLVQVAKFFMIF